MSELANNILENLPYYATAGGALIGAGYDLVTRHNLEAERPGESEAVADAAELIGQPTWIKRAVGATAAAAIFGLTGGAAGAVWAEHQPPVNEKAQLVVVADQAGSTARNNQAGPISRAMDEIASYKSIDSYALSTRNGSSQPVSLSQANGVLQFGRANMHESVVTAIHSFGVNEVKDEGGKSAMVVLTADGLGSAEEIISEDKDLDRPAPITVVNYNKDASAAEIAAEEQIAEKTGGQFLNNPSEADFSKTIDGLAPPKAEAVNDTPDGQKWLVTALAAAGIFAFARKRRHLPLTPNGLSRWFDRDEDENKQLVKEGE